MLEIDDMFVGLDVCSPITVIRDGDQITYTWDDPDTPYCAIASVYSDMDAFIASLPWPLVLIRQEPDGALFGPLAFYKRTDMEADELITVDVSNVPGQQYIRLGALQANYRATLEGQQ